MEDLPADLTIDILSRLPVKNIIHHCKLVCKKWRNLVLDSSFVNLHFSRSPVVLIIHHHPRMNMNMTEDLYVNVSKDPGVLKWLEIKEKVDLHHLRYDPLMTVDLNLVPILRNCDHIGSVNGLICLWNRNNHNPKCDDTYIWNPVTREIMILPSPPSHGRDFFKIVYGFGVDSLTGEYKVVRTFRQDDCSSSSSKGVTEAEIYTLGTGQWRSLGRVPYMINVFHLYYGPFLNDHLHWIVCDEEDALEKICSFDLNKETFQLFPSPPPPEQSFMYFQNLVVLNGCLCKSELLSDFILTIWVMKEYGIKKSWHKEVVITQDSSRWPFLNPVSLIEKDGIILLVSNGILWATCQRSEPIELTNILNFSMSGLAYRPSFLRLQNFESERVHMF